jgi:hypothetical protein
MTTPAQIRSRIAKLERAIERRENPAPARPKPKTVRVLIKGPAAIAIGEGGET